MSSRTNGAISGSTALSILLTGYLTHEEFRRRASLLPVGSCVFQYARTRTKNLSVPITEL